MNRWLRLLVIGVVMGLTLAFLAGMFAIQYGECGSEFSPLSPPGAWCR